MYSSLFTQVTDSFQVPSGATKKVSLTTSTEVNRKLEGKAEGEVTPKKSSLKKADLTLTENVGFFIH